MMSDALAVYALIAVVGLIAGARGYLAVLILLFHKNGRQAMFSRREAVYLGAALFCAAGQDCWTFRGAFVRRVK